MKIICIGKNYREHVREMKGEVPTEPVFFMKPDTALIKDNSAFYLPDFSHELHHEVEIVLKISKNGKHIDEKFALHYFEEIGIGIDFTARDIQEKCKKNGWPWEKAKAFDGAAPIGKFVSKNNFNDLAVIKFHLDINGKTVQKGNTKNLIFSFEKIISCVSKFVTLKTGDLIYTGTPEGVGAVKAGDKLTGYIGEKKLLEFEVR